MSARDMTAVALCGFDATGTDQVGEALNIIGLTLEKALHEAELLRMTLEPSPDALTAGSLWARLKALDAFITEYMDVSWKAQEQAATESEAAE